MEGCSCRCCCGGAVPPDGERLEAGRVTTYVSTVMSCSPPPSALTGTGPLRTPPLLVSAAVDSTAAIDRVKSACHVIVIVAPLVARGAVEHGFADWRGGAGPARGVRAAAGPPLEQVEVQVAHRTPTP